MLEGVRPCRQPRIRLAGLTIVGESGRTPAERLQLMREVNPPDMINLQLETPLPDRDLQTLTDMLGYLEKAESAQRWMNLGVDLILIGWLREVTGMTHAEVVQELAVRVNALETFDS